MIREREKTDFRKTEGRKQYKSQSLPRYLELPAMIRECEKTDLTLCALQTVGVFLQSLVCTDTLYCTAVSWVPVLDLS